MDWKTAQSEIRTAYAHGGPGTLVSGLVWLAAAITEARSNVATGFTVLFFGGILIFPITKILLVALYRRKSESPHNLGGRIVLETTLPMIGGLFAAWLILPHRSELVFPLAAIAVGTHYFGFRTAYGDVTFWLLGGLMSAIGTLSILYAIPPREFVAFFIAVVEVLFGCWLIYIDAKRTPIDHSVEHPSVSG